METGRGNEVYILGLWACFGEMEICGVYTSKLKLIEGYQRAVDEDERLAGDNPDYWPYLVVYKYNANEFVGERPEWNFGGWYINETKYEISIQKVRESVEIYNDGRIQAFCNFNFEGTPKLQVRYIDGSEDEITDADVFLGTDTFEGDFSDEYVRNILPVLKAWYSDNKEILKQIWRTKSYIPIPNWLETDN